MLMWRKNRFIAIIGFKCSTNMFFVAKVKNNHCLSIYKSLFFQFQYNIGRFLLLRYTHTHTCSVVSFFIMLTSFYSQINITLRILKYNRHTNPHWIRHIYWKIYDLIGKSLEQWLLCTVQECAQVISSKSRCYNPTKR